MLKHATYPLGLCVELKMFRHSVSQKEYWGAVRLEYLLQKQIRGRALLQLSSESCNVCGRVHS